jgi:hypothetical protein
MIKDILWKGIKYNSLENCIVTIQNDQQKINSTINGDYDKILYKINYEISTTLTWETVYFEINAQLNEQVKNLRLEKAGHGRWLVNGVPAANFKDCIDIDISLTPFTNSLPVNRLDLNIGETKLIHVLYFDVFNWTIQPVQQRYTRVADLTYQYENVPNDFEALVIFDEEGIVVSYPGLFERTFDEEQ